MKITVEISDDFIEGESLHEAIKSQIRYDVSNEIKRHIKDQVDKEITAVVKKEIEDSLASIVKLRTQEFLDTDTIVVSGAEIKVSDYLKNIFQNNSSWNNPGLLMKDLADKWAKELKNKYDGAFVSQLIQRISEAGLLKPEAAKLLLDTKD